MAQFMLHGNRVITGMLLSSAVGDKIMHFIVYSQNIEWAEHRLKEAIRGVVADNNIHICDDLNGFVDRFRQSFGSLRIGIVVLHSIEELNDLLVYRNVLRQIWTIIILPNRDPQTITKAYRLWPRYISDLDGDLSDIRGILSHIKGRWLSNGCFIRDAAGNAPKASESELYIK